MADIGPRITPTQLDIFSNEISDLYVYLENEIFQMIVERLKAPIDASKDYVFQWQVERLRELRGLNTETLELIAEVTQQSFERIEELFFEAGSGIVEGIDEIIANETGRDIPPTDLQTTLQGYIDQVRGDFTNLVNESLVSSASTGTVASTYRAIINQTTASVIAGQSTINQALVQTINKFQDKGLPSGFIDRGGRRWNIEQYTKSVMRTTTNNAYNAIRLQRMEEFGIDLVLVSSLSSARPTCARCQGTVLTTRRGGRGRYKSIYDFGYGQPDGLRGINCRHTLTPFIEGVNENNLSRVSVPEADEGFKIMQQQRAYERAIRQAKARLAAAEAIGDEKGIEHNKRLLRARQARIRQFIAQNDLPRFYENERNIIQR